MCAFPLTDRLTFPNDIVDNGQQKSAYDVEKGELTVYLPKAVRGQVFENLDMLTTLMAPRPVSCDGAAARGLVWPRPSHAPFHAC